VLRQIAARIELSVLSPSHKSDISRHAVARLGGDEFVVSLCITRGIDWVESHLMPMIGQAVEQPIDWLERELVVTASMGVIASDPGQSLDIKEALRNADIAMYTAKRSCRQAVRFDAVMRQRVCHELETEARLRKAIEQGQITAAFEPVIDLTDGSVLGFEALARWTDPQWGPIPPIQFISIAERTGLIDQVFASVARHAIAAYRQVAPQSPSGLWFSVNLSKTQLTDDRLVDQLTDLMRGSGMDPGLLHLEVTESLVASSADMIERLHRLRAMGHPLMLDDFGSGTSSLSCLKAYPVQWIKIDRELTDAAANHREYSAILKAIADLSANLGLKLIAEGVEHADYIPLLQAMEVNAAQGWYWSKPIAPENLAGWLAGKTGKSKARPRVA